MEQLETEVALLERAQTADCSAERRVGSTTLIFASVVLAIVVGFALGNYLHLVNEWTEDKFTVALRQELGTLSPLATEELRTLGSRVLPVYVDEGRRQFRDLAPEIAAELGEQVSHLGEDLRADVHAKLAAVEDDVRAKALQSLFASYPSLQDSTERARLEANMRAMTEDTVLGALQEFDVRFSADVREIEEILAGFDFAPTEEPTVELQKRFLRAWLRLLDAEIERL